MSDRAESWVKAMYPNAEKKYPDNKKMQALYQDSLQAFKKERLQRLLDSTKDSKIGPFGITTYRDAKDKELMLGLDLQGGMSASAKKRTNPFSCIIKTYLQFFLRAAKIMV